MPFQKGVSGNPNGRPKKSESQIKFERRCREWADTMGFDRLKYWAEKDDIKALPALIEIFNRGFGKSVEIVEANVTSEPSPTVEDLEREISNLLGESTAKGQSIPTQAPVEQGK